MSYLQGSSVRCDYQTLLDVQPCNERTESINRVYTGPTGWAVVPAERGWPEQHYCPFHRTAAHQEAEGTKAAESAFGECMQPLPGA